MTATTDAPADVQPDEGGPPEAIKRYRFNERRPWREFKPLTFIVLVGIQLGGLGTLLYFPLTLTVPSWKAVLLAFGMGIFSTFGVTAGLHRYFTHGGYRTTRWFEAVLLFASAFALEGPAMLWVMWHWVHHKWSDRPGDLHSPYQYSGNKGRAWAHEGWMFFKSHIPQLLPESRQWIRQDPLIRAQYWLYPLFVAATFGIPYLAAGWQGLFIAGFLRLTITLNITWSVNSVCHVWGETVDVKFLTDAELKRWKAAKAKAAEAGVDCTYVPRYRVRKGGDGSRNNWLIAILGLGEGNHALHHLFEEIAYHAWKGGIDATRRLFIILERLGVIWDVRKPQDEAIVMEADLELPGDSLITEWETDRQQRLAA